MTTYVFLGSAADVLLVVVKLLVGGLVIGVVLAGLRRWLFGPPRPRHRTDVRLSDATYAKGRAEVVWSDSHSPDLSRATTSDLLGSVERARR